MKKLYYFLLLFVLVFITSLSHAQTPQQITPVQNGDKILFIGNSYTDWFGPLPTAIKSIFNASGSNIELTTVVKGKGMGIIKEYATWNSLGVIDEIKKGGWKYVVIQSWEDAVGFKDSWAFENNEPNPDYYGWPQSKDTILKYAKILDAEIKNVGAKTILYEPHIGIKYYERDFQRSHETYDTLKSEMTFFHAPIINAWDVMQQRYPNANIQNGACEGFTPGCYISRLYHDCGHQNNNGMMLDALTFYTIFTGGKSALTLDPSYKSTMQNQEYYDEFAQIAFTTGKSILQMNNSFLADAQIPTPVTNIAVSSKKSDSFKLTWTPSTDDIGVLGYRIYRNNVLIDTTALSNYTVRNLVSSTSYTIKIEAFDSEGKISDPATIDVTTDGTTIIDFTGILSQWNFNNIGETYPVSSTNIADGIAEAIVNHGAGMLFQTYGNVNDSYSTRSKNHPSPATLDEAIARNCYISVVITPSSGYNLSITQLNTKLLGDNSLKYGVFSSVSGFEIGDIISTQDGGGIRTINLAGHTSIIEPVEFRFYAYGQDYVWGYAGFGQWDDHTNDDLVITGSIKNNDMPSFPTDLSATNLTETGFTLNWKAALNAATYTVYKNGVLVGTTADLFMNIGSVIIGEKYSLTVSATTGTGTISELSDALEVTIPDLHTPSIPTNLSISGVTSSSFILDWDSSTDNVGVTRYEIYMDGQSYSSTNESYLPVPYLTANTSYVMTVRAVDAAENRSAFSESIIASTVSTSNKKINDEIVKLSIFPNPASEVLTIKLENNALHSIAIYNTKGSLMKSLSGISNKIDIDVSTFSEGLYLMNVKSDSASENVKFLIQK